MNRALRLISFVVLAIFLSRSPVRADEGMWLFHQPPRQLLKAKYQFDLSDSLLERLQKATVHFGKRGTGSFVSANGLVLTNHHVAELWLEKLPADKKNLIDTGFYAARRDEELRCPDLELYVVWSSEDVTRRVQDAIKPAMTLAEASRARRETICVIEKESKMGTGLVSEVKSLYHGGEYHLYRYKKYTDVRLVFAPAKACIDFPNNTQLGSPIPPMYITGLFDACFFRAYDENGKVVRPAHHLKFTASLPKSMDLVFAPGFPGRSDRFRTAADLDDTYGPKMLLTMKAVMRQLAVLDQFDPKDPEMAKAKMEVAGRTNQAATTLENLEKYLAALRRKEAQEYTRLLAVNDKLAAQYREALAKIESCNQSTDRICRRYFFLEMGMAFYSDLFRFARFLVRQTEDMAADDVLAAETEHNLQTWREGFFESKPMNEKLEIAKLAESLALFVSQANEDADLVKKILNGKTCQECAADLVNGSTLEKLSARLALLKGGKDAVAKSNDAMIELARLVEARSRQVSGEYGATVIEPMRRAYASLHRVRRQSSTSPMYPDATRSLRISFGKLLSTQETLHRLFFDYKLPMNWLAAKNRIQLGVALSLRVSADVVYGNSGSPVVDREGHMLGVLSKVVPGNAKVGFELSYDDDSMFISAVCVAGIVELLDKVYGAGPLVEELGGNFHLEAPNAKSTLPGGSPPLTPPAPINQGLDRTATAAGKPRAPDRLRQPEPIAALIKALGDADDGVANGAERALEKIGAEAIPALVEAMAAKDQRLGARAARILGKMSAVAQTAITSPNDEQIVGRDGDRGLSSVLLEPPVGAQLTSTGNVDVLRITTRQIKIPMTVSAPREKIKEVQLLASTDKGKTWNLVNFQGPNAQAFSFMVLRDDTYWFSTRIVFADDTTHPADFSSLSAALKVQVATNLFGSTAPVSSRLPFPLVSTAPSSENRDKGADPTAVDKKQSKADSEAKLNLSLAPPPPSAVAQPVTSAAGASVQQQSKIRAWVNGLPLFDDEFVITYSPQLVGDLTRSPNDPHVKEAVKAARGKLIDMELMFQDAVNRLENANSPDLGKLQKEVEAQHEIVLSKTRANFKKLNAGLSETQYSNKEAKFLEDLEKLKTLLRRKTEREVIAMEYMQAWFYPKVKLIGPMEIKAEYDAHRDTYVSPGKLEWQDVFIAVDKDIPTVADARRFAEGLLIRHQNDFQGLLAYDQGDCKHRGGYGIGSHPTYKMGEKIVPTDVRPAEMEPHLVRMREGENTIVEISTGVHIVHLVKYEPSKQLEFTFEVQMEIRNRLLTEMYERERECMIRELRARAGIVMVAD